MKLSRLALLACTSLPLLLALSLPADDLSFHPAANTEAPKTLKIDMELNVKEMAFLIDGQPMPGDPLGQVTENALIVNMLVGVTEKYVETKDGKPVVLLRTYDKLKLDTEFGDDSTEVESFSEPEGKTISFKWDEEEGAYTKSYHESEGDEADLKELDVDMDLRALLPDKKVEKGDTWEVPAAKLGAVFLPGGMIAKSEGEEDAEAFEKIRASLEEQFLDALKDFKVTCTYKGTKEDEGLNVGEITFAYDGKMKLDLGSLIEEAIDANRQEGMPEMDVKANLGVALKGDGTLLWNLAAGHMHNFEMHADADMDVDMAVHMQMGDMTQNMSLTGQAGSKINWELSKTEK
jgi:hypothetical protein